MAYFKPEISTKFYENFNGRDCLKRNEACTAVDTYLSTIFTNKTKTFKAKFNKRTKSAQLSMDKNAVVWDKYNGIMVKWYSGMNVSESGSPSQGPFSNGVIRYYKLTYNREYHKIITEKYVHYVISQGREIKSKKKQKKFSNNSYCEWTDIVLEHPGTFQTLAMDPKEEEIINDLINFTNRKEYYAKIAKAWRRGYLLYGPPGTGKSTMIAAMANFLDYDIYNIELRAIKDNTELRMMLSETTNRVEN